MQHEKKNIFIIIIFLFFVIFSKSLKQKCLIPTESCILDGKKPNIAKFVDNNFLARNEKIARLYALQKWKDKWLFSANPMNMVLWVFLHAEFISALKTEPKSMRNMQKIGKKYLSLLFSFSV